MSFGITARARGYLASHGLGSEEAFRNFRLGFADRTLGYHLPGRTRKEGARVRARLQRLGVLRASGHEHLSGSLVVPVFDEDGQVAELYGRKITRNLRPGTPRPPLPPRPAPRRVELGKRAALRAAMPAEGGSGRR